MVLWSPAQRIYILITIRCEQLLYQEASLDIKVHDANFKCGNDSNQMKLVIQRHSNMNLNHEKCLLNKTDQKDFHTILLATMCLLVIH